MQRLPAHKVIGSRVGEGSNPDHFPVACFVIGALLQSLDHLRLACASLSQNVHKLVVSVRIVRWRSLAKHKSHEMVKCTLLLRIQVGWVVLVRPVLSDLDSVLLSVQPAS